MTVGRQSFHLTLAISFILILGLTSNAKQLDPPPQPTPEPKPPAAPQPAAPPRDGPYDKFVNACVARMTEQCALEIVNGIFNGTAVGKECCTKLAYFGKDCHTEMIKHLLTVPGYKTPNATQVKHQSMEVFKRCAAGTKIPPEEYNNIPKRPPRSQCPGYKEFLDECAKHISNECGREVVFGIFDDKPISAPCCIDLVTMGEDCHEELLSELQQTEQFKKDPKLIQQRSDKVWKTCSDVASKAPKPPKAP